MLGLTLQLASTFPCKPMRSASNGYFLYAPETVAKALHELGGLEAWRPRRARALRTAILWRGLVQVRVRVRVEEAKDSVAVGIEARIKVDVG